MIYYDIGYRKLEPVNTISYIGNKFMSNDKNTWEIKKRIELMNIISKIKNIYKLFTF